MERRVLAFGGFDLLSEGRAATRARAHVRKACIAKRPALGIVTSLGIESATAAAWVSRASSAGFRVEVIGLDESEAGGRLVSKDLLYFPAGHTAHLLHRLRPMASELKRAWERGLVLSGSSGGGLCWFLHLWSASMFGAPEWLPGLGFLPGAAIAHFDQQGYVRPTSAPVGASASPVVVGLDEDAMLDWREGRLESVAVRPDARVHELDCQGRSMRTVPCRDLSSWFALLIRIRRVLGR